ncbi:MAG: universal stress protein [Pseudonocardiaceae bacterium]
MTAANALDAVVAGVDGSQAALQAVRWAAIEARDVPCSLRLVHTLQWPLVGYPAPPGLRADWTNEIHEQGCEWLREAEEAATLTAPEVQVQVRLLTGDPRQCLLSEAENARELVVGSRGLGGFTGMVLGSTSVAVAQHAPCPVVVVHGPGIATGPVVVGLDGSVVSEQALGYAFEAASRAGAPLLAVHAWGDLGKEESWLVKAAGMTLDEIEAAGHRMLAEQLAGWQDKYPGVSVEPRVIHRQLPAAALIELGRQARMIVVGAHGRGGFTRLLLGSVSHAVAQHATCPVAVCRPARRPTDQAAAG